MADHHSAQVVAWFEEYVRKGSRRLFLIDEGELRYTKSELMRALNAQLDVAHERHYSKCPGAPQQVKHLETLQLCANRRVFLVEPIDLPVYEKYRNATEDDFRKLEGRLVGDPVALREYWTVCAKYTDPDTWAYICDLHGW